MSRLGRLAAWPIRAVARERPPAVDDPSSLGPGAAPPTGGRLLVLFDGGCGICLHGRDVIAVLDRRHRLAYDRIARHETGLLAAVPDAERYATWHVIHPDGRREEGGAGAAAVVGALPGGRLLERVLRRHLARTDAAYGWFVRHRGRISRATGLTDHPQRDPGEQPQAS